MVSGEDERRNYTGAMEYCGQLGAGLASPADLMALRNYVLLQLGECGEKWRKEKDRCAGKEGWRRGRKSQKGSIRGDSGRGGGC